LPEFPGSGSLIDPGGAIQHGGICGRSNYLVGRGKGFIAIGVVFLPNGLIERQVLPLDVEIVLRVERFSEYARRVRVGRVLV